MYLERLKRVLSTERGLHLTFSSGDTEESIELSPEAVEQTFKTLHGVTRGCRRRTVDASRFWATKLCERTRLTGCCFARKSLETSYSLCLPRF